MKSQSFFSAALRWFWATCPALIAPGSAAASRGRRWMAQW